MQRKKIALISDAWVPQVNGVVTTFQSIIPILEKKGFQIKILHPEMFSNFSYPWYKEIKISYNTKKITDSFNLDFLDPTGKSNYLIKNSNPLKMSIFILTRLALSEVC